MRAWAPPPAPLVSQAPLEVIVGPPGVPGQLQAHECSKGREWCWEGAAGWLSRPGTVLGVPGSACGTASPVWGQAVRHQPESDGTTASPRAFLPFSWTAAVTEDVDSDKDYFGLLQRCFYQQVSDDFLALGRAQYFHIMLLGLYCIQV